MTHKRVVITGIGPLASTGIGKESFWEGFLHKETGLKLVKEIIGDKIWDEFYVHKIKNFNIKEFGIDEKALEFIEDWKESSLDFDLQYLLAAVKLSLDDAYIDYTHDQDMGIIVTNESPGVENFVNMILEETFKNNNKRKDSAKKEFYSDIYYKIVKLGYEIQTFMPLFHIAKTFNIHKHSLFINNACASGLYAIETASDMIKLNKVPIMIVAGGDHPNIFKHLWFKMLDMYESDGKMKPFSTHGQGLVMGEGAAALLLEEYEHAKKRGVHIYAEYLGGGFRLEGWQITRPKIGSNSYQETIKDALVNSGLEVKDIDLICLHGFGTLAGDYYEGKAVEDVFGRDTPVTALKPYIGHNLGGSTLIETSALLLALGANFIPSILNTQIVNPKIDINLVMKDKNLNMRNVIKICSAFAGFNAAGIFKKLDLK